MAYVELVPDVQGPCGFVAQPQQTQRRRCDCVRLPTGPERCFHGAGTARVAAPSLNTPFGFFTTSTTRRAADEATAPVDTTDPLTISTTAKAQPKPLRIQLPLDGSPLSCHPAPETLMAVCPRRRQGGDSTARGLCTEVGGICCAAILCVGLRRSSGRAARLPLSDAAAFGP